ncbi:MAG: hypothetical protein JRI25_09945, partial [Deltaproteobacteria bacterium]|nr:hypothetical protein [Deltaproteobacteria bacterium]
MTGGTTWEVSEPHVLEAEPGDMPVAGTVGTAELVALWGGVQSRPVVLEVLGPRPLRITIEPTPDLLPEGTAPQLHAWATYLDGTVANLTAEVTW